MPNIWIWSLQVFSPFYWVFQLMLSPLGPGNLLLSGIWDFLVATTSPHLPLLLSSFHFSLCPPTPDPATLSSPSYSIPLRPSIPPFSCSIILFPPSKQDWSIHTVVFLLLELRMLCELYLGSSEFWANTNLSVSAYCECSFVTGLSHFWWCFLVPFICLKFSWSHCF